MALAARDAARRARTTLGALFAIDVRSLAAFRVALGALLVADLAKRALAFALHYTDAGVLPRAVARELLAEPAWFARAHFAFGSAAGQAFLFALAGAAAVALAVGFRARLAAALSYLLLLSLQMRNPLVNHTGDAYLLTLVFWAMFVPLGASRARTLRAVRGIGAAMLLVQIAVFYLAAGALKHEQAIWREGQALWLFLHENAYARPTAAWLLPYEQLLRIGTWGALLLEGVAPLLFFSPWQTARVRTALVAVFAAFHLSIQALIYIGLFEWTSIAALLVFVPGEMWERVGWRLPAAQPDERDRSARASLSERALQAVAAVCGAYVLLSNAASVGIPTPELPKIVGSAGRALRLDQHWAIFTQLDGLDAGWFAVVAEFPDGRRYDWISKRTVESESELLSAPVDFAGSYANHNERRYWRHIRQERFAAFRPALADVACRRALPGAGGSELRPLRVRVLQIVERVRADGVVEPPHAELLIDRECASARARS